MVYGIRKRLLKTMVTASFAAALIWSTWRFIVLDKSFELP